MGGSRGVSKAAASHSHRQPAEGFNDIKKCKDYNQGLTKAEDPWRSPLRLQMETLFFPLKEYVHPQTGLLAQKIFATQRNLLLVVVPLDEATYIACIA